jgi:TolB protein
MPSPRTLRFVPVLALLGFAAGCDRSAAPVAPSYLGGFTIQSTGGKIAFTSNRDGNNEIYVMNADGTGVTRLTDNPADDQAPTWSPDGSRIAFASTRDGNREIYVMNADGTVVTRLTDDPNTDTDPAWCGNRIAFMSDRFLPPFPDVYVMNDDGTGVTRLTIANADFDRQPAWSPTCDRIAFTKDPSGNVEIYVMNADGTGATRLTNSPGVDEDPAWSPDGTRIAFTSTRDGDPNREIYVMNADGTGATRLTSTSISIFDTDPSWSPDGNQIAFRSNRDGNDEIYVMNADGTGVTRLTNDASSDGQPAWGGAAVPAASAWPNEPANATLISDWAMNNPPTHRPHPFQPTDEPISGSPGWGVVYEEPVGPDLPATDVVLGTDPSALMSPDTVYDFVFPAGMMEGYAPGTVYRGVSPTVRQLYVGFWWKASNQFDIGPNGNKVAFIFNGGGDTGGQIVLMMGHNGTDRVLSVLPEYPGDFVWREPNQPGAAVVTLDVWHQIEWLINLDTHVLQWWMDGELQGSYTDLTNPVDIDGFEFSPTFGGNIGATKQTTDHFWFDHVHLSTAP